MDSPFSKPVAMAIGFLVLAFAYLIWSLCYEPFYRVLVYRIVRPQKEILLDSGDISPIPVN